MLELYKNIRDKRIELGLSQDELALKTGYTSRASISRIEKGEIDLPQSKLELFAKALQTTPGELMGWEEQPKEPIRTPAPKIPKEEPSTRHAFSFADKVELFDFDDNPNDELFADDNDNIIPHRRLPKLDFSFGDTPRKPHREHPFDLARRIDQQDMCAALFAQLDDDDRDEIIEIMEIKLKRAKYHK